MISRFKYFLNDYYLLIYIIIYYKASHYTFDRSDHFYCILLLIFYFNSLNFIVLNINKYLKIKNKNLFNNNNNSG